MKITEMIKKQVISVCDYNRVLGAYFNLKLIDLEVYKYCFNIDWTNCYACISAINSLKAIKL